MGNRLRACVNAPFALSSQPEMDEHLSNIEIHFLKLMCHKDIQQ